MLRTITISSCVQAQGTFVRKTKKGTIVVRIGSREVEGRPISKTAAA